MEKPLLKDFEKWKNMNKDLSPFDYIFCLTRQEELSSDLYFAFLELLWPSFIIYKNYIFLKATYSVEKVESLINEKHDVEFWANLLTVDSFFENEEDGEERSEFFARSLVESWQAKLKHDFPDKHITVKYVSDSEFGDYGLTFYQNKE